MNLIRILLADDHAMMREGLRGLLARQPDMQVVGEAEEGDAVLRLAKLLQPGLVVMDITMPGLDGVEATFQISQVCSRTRVLVFTAHASVAMFNRARRAGAAGYLLKLVNGQQILAAVRIVAGGGTYFDPELCRAAGAEVADPGPPADLSNREAQVLRLLAQGYIAKEIADQLKVSPKSVETYKARLMVKLGINSRLELLRYAAAIYPADRP